MKEKKTEGDEGEDAKTDGEASKTEEGGEEKPMDVDKE